MKHSELFERLDPPRGGLSRLRARLDARSRARPRLVLLAAAAALGALVLLVVARSPPRDLVAAAQARGGAPEIELGLLPMPRAAVALTEEQRPTTALAEVQTTNPNVSFYWVSSTTWRD